MTKLVLVPAITLATLAFAPDSSAQGTIPLVPYGSNFRYEIVPHTTGAAGWFAPGFDDSAWANGCAPFGVGCVGSSCTTWNGLSDLLTRTDFVVPAGLTSCIFELGIEIDNNCQAWVNGIDVTGFLTSGGCAFPDRWVVEVPAAILVPGSNLLAVLGHDFGPPARLDVELRAIQTIGQPFCVPVANSTGSAGVLRVGGSQSVATNDLRLCAESLSLGSFAMFIASSTTQPSIVPPGSSGNLCLGGSVSRIVGSLGNTGMTGRLSYRLDVNQVPGPAGVVAIQAGETWYFQAWHRDSLPPGTATSNFTGGVEVTFN